LIDFVTNMDAKTWRSLIVSFVLFGGLTGKAGVEHWLALARGPWALPIAVAAFAVLAFLGAPQVVLIAAAAVVFGPWTGSLYSWIGTFVSALIGFELGRLFGGRLIRDLKSPGVERFMALIGKNGLMASLIIRLVPAAPFIVVNMAAGTARVRRVDFALGTAIGILPKILLTAFAGGTMTAVFNGGGLLQFGLLALAIALWVGSALLARRWLRAREAAAVGKPADAPASGVHIAADGEVIVAQANGGEWRNTWHPAGSAPEGKPHGSTGLCITPEGQVVLINQRGARWEWPGGRPEGDETIEETLRREMLEEICCRVTSARLLGFSRGACVSGHETGLVLVRSIWLAEVEVLPWDANFEVAERGFFAPAELRSTFWMDEGWEPIFYRALVEAELMTRPDAAA
jgi:uncharacterized membrane protein YdjX (TVP38/TMEM64 family)/ADP-ribose pyrophosphatase YjhB (NUDIX family)